ncbi:OLC1v1032660C1 [Oldenlandia corymbosa var. corymbosa]|uniref:OLC1v1032660C1 n=1 Tax=Oldenlandia corymbosa var. corymbosa TaxID=529605 RepID=A0AAV1CMY3_OLDCO|nr:OLC1v1032660C1 [Oldenlandia corymbosa var. corymbosa]
MEIERSNASVFDRPPRPYANKNKVCHFWLQDRCNRNPCRFLHPAFPESQNCSGNNFKYVNDVRVPNSGQIAGSKNGQMNPEKGILARTTEQLGSKQKKLCPYWVDDRCVYGPLVFAGLRNAVKVLNMESNTDIVLPSVGGLVNAMVLNDGVLFAGVEDGSILAWKSNSQSGKPEELAALKGHNSAVISLVVGANRLFSGSKDQTVRVWDLQTLECIHTLRGHNGSVTSLICWDKFLFSGSLDKSLKIWGASADQSGDLEVMHEMKQESGILALCGITKEDQQQHILLCSSEDNVVRMYDLPSFAEKGRTYSKGQVLAVETGPGGLFFTGDSTGKLNPVVFVIMWKCLSNAFGSSGPKKVSSSESLPFIEDSSDDETCSNVSVEEGLECPICWESFNIVENVPYVLWCGHTLCKNCVLGLKWAALKFSSQHIQIPFFISCPWCNLLTFRLIYKGNLRFPSKNFFLLWMVESRNGDRMKTSSSICGDHQVWSPRCTSVIGNPASSTLNRRVHRLGNSGSNNNEIGLANRTNTMDRPQFSFQKSLDYFFNLTAKLPLIVVLLTIVVFALPSSAVILILYLVITIVFAVPAFLVLYFGYPALDWLAREITS